MTDEHYRSFDPHGCGCLLLILSASVVLGALVIGGLFLAWVLGVL